jgi:hypothetical protein
MSELVEEALRPSPFPAKLAAKREIRICVPDEWYRRSKSRSLSLTPIDGGDTFQEGRLSSDSNNNDEDQEGGTAKQKSKAETVASASSEKQRASQAQRFSLFDGWGNSPSSNSRPLSSALPGDRSSVSVSAPVAMLDPQRTGLGIDLAEEINLPPDAVNAEFERMMVSSTRVRNL